MMMIGIVRLPNLSMGRGNSEYLAHGLYWNQLCSVICFSTVVEEQVLVLVLVLLFLH